LATRLPAGLAEEVRRYARRRRMGPSQALRAIVGEWVTMSKYPAVEFRGGPDRRPGLRGGPDVWEVLAAARQRADKSEGLSSSLGWRLSAEQLRQAMAYAEEHPEDVDAWIEEPERMGSGDEERRGSGPAVPSGAAVRQRIARDLRSQLEGELDVAFAYLFGSLLAEVAFRDVDVGVQLRGGARDLNRAAELAQRLSAAVGHSVDVRVLNGAPVSFLYHVLRGELLLSRDDALLGDVIERTVRSYLDSAPLLRGAAREAFAA
jgi:predicted nucleotidyltransferase